MPGFSNTTMTPRRPVVPQQTTPMNPLQLPPKQAVASKLPTGPLPPTTTNTSPVGSSPISASPAPTPPSGVRRGGDINQQQQTHRQAGSLVQTTAPIRMRPVLPSTANPALHSATVGADMGGLREAIGRAGVLPTSGNVDAAPGDNRNRFAAAVFGPEAPVNPAEAESGDVVVAGSPNNSPSSEGEDTGDQGDIAGVGVGSSEHGLQSTPQEEDEYWKRAMEKHGWYRGTDGNMYDENNQPVNSADAMAAYKEEQKAGRDQKALDFQQQYPSLPLGFIQWMMDNNYLNTEGVVTMPDGSQTTLDDPSIDSFRDRWSGSPAYQPGGQVDPATNQPAPITRQPSPEEDWLREIMQTELPQTSQAEADALIQSQQQLSAFNEANDLSAALEAAARAGLSPEAQSGFASDVGHRYGAEQNNRAAQTRYQIAKDNLMAQMNQYDQKLQAIRMLMAADIDAESRRQLMAAEKQMMALRTNAEKDLIKYQHELTQPGVGDVLLGGLTNILGGGLTLGIGSALGNLFGGAAGAAGGAAQQPRWQLY